MTSRAGQTYRIFIARPDGPAPEAGFPILYLLDGNAVFGTAVEAARLGSGLVGPRSLDPLIVVGIGYPTDLPLDLKRRTLDLTPPAEKRDLPPRPDGSAWPPSGGAAAFLAFIEDELKPAIQREHPVDQARQTLAGHSFGGLFALYALFTKPGAFQNLVAASPSIWWNARAILADEERFRAAGGISGPTRLLLTVGGDEQPVAANEPEAGPRLLRRSQARLVDNAREMAERLSRVANLSTQFHLFPGENHGSVIPAATGKAVWFASAAHRGAHP